MRRIFIFSLLAVCSLFLVPFARAQEADVSPTAGARGEKKEERRVRILASMKQKLSAVVERQSARAVRMRGQISRIRAKAQELSTTRGIDIVPVESELQLAEEDIAAAEQKTAEGKSAIELLDQSSTPKAVAQTFKTIVQDVHRSYVSAQKHLVASIKLLRESIKETRPTGEAKPTKETE